MCSCLRILARAHPPATVASLGPSVGLWLSPVQTQLFHKATSALRDFSFDFTTFKKSATHLAMDPTPLGPLSEEIVGCKVHRDQTMAMCLAGPQRASSGLPWGQGSVNINLLIGRVAH